MKILLTNFHDGDGGGHTTYLTILARDLAARHDVHVAAPGSSRLYRQVAALPGVHALSQPFPNGLKHLAAAQHARRGLTAYLRAQRFDIVHVNGSADHRLVLAALRGLQPRPRIVFTKHNSKALGGLGHWWRARGTDLAIGVSEATRRMLKASPYARCAPLTIRNGVDVEHYRPWPADATADARGHFLGDAELLLGSNAGTAEHKGWMDLAEALALLPEAQRRRVRVLLCGKPPSSTQRDRLQALHVDDRFIFAGMLDDVRPAIATIDVGFVLSYAVETISFA
ncbi:MAG: glycosyltransferase family 1 protein, partial [Lysobacteraceae bacterium]